MCRRTISSDRCCRTNNNNSITTNNFRSLTQGSDLFIKFTVSETNTDFQENDITITNGTILNFNNSGGGIYTCLLRANTPTTGFTLCEIKVTEGKCKDNEGNLNSTSNVFNFKYDNIRPTMTITAFKSINDRTLNQNSIGAGNYNQSDINPENELFIKMISSELTNNFTINDIVALFSCFTNIRIQDDYKVYNANTDNIELNECANTMKSVLERFYDNECSMQINAGNNTDFHFDLMSTVQEWCDADTELKCKEIIQTIQLEKGIFLGEFIKAILKINNMSNELNKICEINGNIHLQNKLQHISVKTLKYIATNQSLYI